MAETEGHGAPAATQPSETLAQREEIESEPQPMTILEYLTTPEGNAIAGRVLSMFESIQSATINSAADQRGREVAFQKKIVLTWQIITGVIIIVTVIASVWLAFYDKLSAAVTGFFGLLVGYLLGRREKG